MKLKKITFKTVKPTGRYGSFYSCQHISKYNGAEVGMITDKDFKVRLMVMKDNLAEDGNPNSDWKWVQLKKENSTLQEAKDWLLFVQDSIFQTYNIKLK